MFAANVVLCSSTIVPPVKIKILLVVCVMPLLIDRTLRAPLPTTRQQLEEFSFHKAKALLALPTTIRQQLVEAHPFPPILACPSTAPQLNQVGWA